MSMGHTQSVALLGITGSLIEIEVDISDGIPMYSLLGLPDAALQESRDRVRAAITNCKEIWPNRKVTVSMSPAWLPKSGSSFDLSIALSILIANQVLPQDPLNETVVLGELALDGKIRSVRGVLPALIAAYKSGMTRAIIPFANRDEAQLMPQMQILAFENLRDVLQWMRTGIKPEAQELDLQNAKHDADLDFADVADRTRRALPQK